MKRYLVYPLDFDSRALLLATEIQDDWEDQIKEQWRQNKEKVENEIRSQYGDVNLDRKIIDFADFGRVPFSIFSYHNDLLHQARSSFVHGLYYPALVSLCTLGERILNHLILDLRDDFKSSAHYRKVYRKESFDNWEKMIEILSDWEVFQSATVADNFGKLRAVRNRSIHFNEDTYKNLRADALEASDLICAIIETQFGHDGQDLKWLIPGTLGHRFVRHTSEQDPFLRRFYFPQCPKVSPYFSINFIADGVLFFDFENASEIEVPDDEFCKLFNERKSDQIAPNTSEKVDGVRCWFLSYSDHRLYEAGFKSE